MTACPGRGVFRQQAAVLLELKSFERCAGLRHVEAVRVTDLAGCTREEPWPRLQVGRRRPAAAPAKPPA